MEVTVSLPDELFQEAEELAAELGLSRSELHSTAIQRFVWSRRPSSITEAINRVYENVEQEPDPFLEACSFAALRQEPW